MLSVWIDAAPRRGVARDIARVLWPGAWRAPFAPLVVTNQRRPASLPGGRWVRVRNRLAGIDEGDLDLARGANHSASLLALPTQRQRFIGREVVGEVIEVGLEVTLVRNGDRVTLMGEPASTCEMLGLQPPCRSCAAGNVAICEHRALPWPGCGAGWSSEMIVHESQLYQPPEDLSDEQALMLEPAARAVRALSRMALDPGTPTLVLGGGTMAQLLATAARTMLSGVPFAAACDLPHQVEALKALEVAKILPRHPRDLLPAAAALTSAQIFQKGRAQYLLGGYEVVFDTEGSADSLDLALRLTRSGGTVIMVAGHGRPIRLEASPLWLDEVSILGIGNPGAESVPEDMERSVGVRSSNFALAARLMRKQQLRTPSIITHRLPATQLRRALAIATLPARHRATRVIIVHAPQADGR